MKQAITVRVNGRDHTSEVEPRKLLIYYLRDTLRLKGAHVGCETGNCGACTVLVNGVSVKSCMMLAVQADQGEILTVEGLAEGGKLHPIQDIFSENHALQCGFCTPGMIMTTYALLKGKEKYSEEGIREAIHGNLCRCTGYQNIVKAIRICFEKLGDERI